MLADEVAGLRVHGDRAGAQPDDDPPAGERGIGRVAVRAVDAGLSLLVGLAMHVPDHLERRFRQPRHRDRVLDERLLLVLALEVMRLGQRAAPAQQPRVEQLDAAEPRDRHEQVRPHEPDLALDVALLVPGIGAAEREGEPIMGGERGEGLGGPDLVADPAADARGVVEDEPGGDAAHEFEDLLERLAHALGVLGREDLGEPDVRIGEREHEEVHPAPCVGDGEIGLPEVGLRLAGAPHQVEVGFGDSSPLGLEIMDVMPDGGLTAGGAVLVAKPLPYTARGVPLLAAAPLVLVEVPLDDGPVRVEHLLL